MRIHSCDSVSSLPDQWDEQGNGVFTSRVFLGHLERVNPCQARYFLGEGVAGVSYAHRLNLLTYTKWRLRLPLRILGLPCSLAAPGVWGEEERIPAFMDQIRREEARPLLALNLPGKTHWPQAQTLPTYRLRVCWSHLDAYRSDLRSHYRRAMARAEEEGEALTFSLEQAQSMTEPMYQQYLRVREGSKYPLESLTHSFFTELPLEHYLLVARLLGEPVGWFLLVPDGRTLVFAFGGLSPGAEEWATYRNLLYQSLDLAIREGFSTLDLGQTADVAKARLGAQAHPLVLAAAHPNGVIHRALPPLLSILGYRGGEVSAQPFAERGAQS